LVEQETDHVGRGLLVGSQTTNRLLSTQYGIYEAVLVLVLVARDEHLSGRDVCGKANHVSHMHVT
jgi:hypothetical protein